MTGTSFVGALALAALLCAGATDRATAQESQLVLKMQFASPDGTPWNSMDRRYAKQIEEITGAKVKFFPPNSVTPFGNWLQATGSGLLDIGFVWQPVLPGKFLQMSMFSLPGLVPNQTVGTVVYWRLREEFPKEMTHLYTAQDNVVNLGTYVAMGSQLHTRTPIRTLDQIKGKVFAAQDAEGAEALRRLGASATVMVGSDAYLALQRGSVEGVLCAWGWVNNFKLNEVAKYHTLLNLDPGTYSEVMNRDTWNKLSPVAQARLKQLRPMYFFYNTTDSAAQAMKDIPADHVFKLSAADEASLVKLEKPLWAAWVKEADAKGWPGQKMLDEAERLMQLYNDN